MSEVLKPTNDDPAAPFGREADDTPIAPYGLRQDGVPRRSGAGRKGGQASAPRPPARKRQRSAATSSAPRAAVQSGPTDQERRDTLISLADMFLVNGLVAAALAPPVRQIIGDRHAYALAGDAVIVNHFAPPVADGLIELAKTKPGILAWMDSIAEKAPYLLLMKAGFEMAKALASNHANPSERLANAGMALGMMNAQRMAEAVEREAAEMGIPVFNVPQESAA